MSKIVKGVGKVFKKVVKTVVKIAPYALAAAAVVFTGGAALGLGFAAGGFSAAVGGVVTSLGIGGAVGGALTGAITGAGMGAAVGGILGGKKGLKKGFITGALTGGVLGAASPGSVGIVKNAAGQWTTKQGIINAAGRAGSSAASSAIPPGFGPDVQAGVTPGGVGGVGPVQTLGPGGVPASSAPGGITHSSAAAINQPVTGLNAGGAISANHASLAQTVNNLPVAGSSAVPAAASGGAPVAGTFAPAVSSPAAQVATTAAKTGGLFGQGGFFQQNPALAGNLLTSVGGVLSGGDDETQGALDVLRARTEEEQRMAQFGYGGVYTGKPGAFGNQAAYAPPPPRWFINPRTNRVEEVPV